MGLQSTTVGTARRAARAILSETTDTAALDADLLLCEATSFNRDMLSLLEPVELSSVQEAGFKKLLERRMAGEPIAYITRSKAFWTIQVQVNCNTLVPRPETELVVECGLLRCKKHGSPQIADLGTGCGCIALAIATELPGAHIVATDLSSQALEVAKKNRAALGLENVDFYLGDWTKALPDQKFDLIVANPPYIADNDPCLKDRHLSFEPQVALNGGLHGLESIQNILSNVRSFLNPGGWMIVEHGFDQGGAVQRLFIENGFSDITTHKDLAGLERVTEGCNNQAVNSASTGV